MTCQLQLLGGKVSGHESPPHRYLRRVLEIGSVGMWGEEDQMSQ